MAEIIDDPDDPRVAPFRNVRERDLVGREGQFIAEGAVVVERLLSSDLCRPLAVLVAQKRLASLEPVLKGCPAPVYAAAQPVIDAIAGFPLHRGVLALGEPVERPTVQSLIARLPPQALVVGLYGIGNHDNMGGLFRNAAAFGAGGVFLAADCCDPFYRKAIRVSVGASLITPFARAAADEDIAEALSKAGFDVLALSPSGASALSQIRRAPRTAVLFGSEGPGLPQAVMARTKTVRIPMAGGFDSLNVATTSGIVLSRLVEI